MQVDKLLHGGFKHKAVAVVGWGKAPCSVGVMVCSDARMHGQATTAWEVVRREVGATWVPLGYVEELVSVLE